MRYFECAFKPGGKTYCYGFIGETPPAIGEKVRAESREGSWQYVAVVSETQTPPKGKTLRYITREP